MSDNDTSLDNLMSAARELEIMGQTDPYIMGGDTDGEEGAAVVAGGGGRVIGGGSQPQYHMRTALSVPTTPRAPGEMSRERSHSTGTPFRGVCRGRVEYRGRGRRPGEQDPALPPPPPEWRDEETEGREGPQYSWVDEIEEEDARRAAEEAAGGVAMEVEEEDLRNDGSQEESGNWDAQPSRTDTQREDSEIERYLNKTRGSDVAVSFLGMTGEEVMDRLQANDMVPPIGTYQ